MYCNKCGNKLDNDSLFCAHCGAKVVKEHEEKAEAKTNDGSGDHSSEKQENVKVETAASEAGDTVVKEMPVSQVTPVNTETPPQENKGKTKKGKKLAVAAAAVVVAGLAAVGIFTLTGSSKKVAVDPISQCNFNNLAHIAYDDNSIFYIGTYDSDDDDTCIYSTTYNGTNKTKILEDDDIIRIRSIGDKIYYLKSKDDDNFIGSVKKDGSDNKTIIKYADNDDEMGYEYNVYGDTLYYITGSRMRSCSLDGSNDAQIKSTAYDFVMVGDLLYYSDRDTINVYNMKNKEETELCAAAKAEDLVYENGNLFYRTSNGLYYKSTEKEDSSHKISGNSELSKYIIDNDVIYFLEKVDTDDIVSLAKYMADDDDSDYLKYGLMMIGISELKKVDKFGGNEEYQNSDHPLIFALYDTPAGKIAKISVFSDTFEPLEIK